ncbi:hypothetical protein [Nostoc sp.]|uniref:hypothetical protein n=1 Tax=Nostoc sp. TaxID=1180 RepID=UPI002FF7BD47
MIKLRISYLVIGHWALGIRHWALGIGQLYSRTCAEFSLSISATSAALSTSSLDGAGVVGAASRREGRSRGKPLAQPLQELYWALGISFSAHAPCPMPNAQ